MPETGAPVTWPSTSTVFARLDAAAKSDSVARRLGDSIRLGLLPDGQQLPKEIDLARRFGVSPVTLREALAALRREGLLDTRRGRGGGTFVRAPREHSEQWLVGRLQEKTLEEIRDFGDYRASLESGAARLSAARAARNDFASLRHRLEQLADARSMDDRRKADSRFRIELAAASQSARLTRAVIAIQAEVGNLLWLPFNEQVDIADLLALRENAVAAVERRDPEAAGNAVNEFVAAEIAGVLRLRLSLFGVRR